MRIVRFLAPAIAATAAIAVPGSAAACSCASAGSPLEDARAIVERSDAAFIGVLRSVRGDGGTAEGLGVPKAVFRYRIKRAYGAKLGRFVKVRGGTQESSCGLVGRTGRRYALGLSGSRGDWTSDLCRYMSPRALRKIGDEPRRPEASSVRCRARAV